MAQNNNRVFEEKAANMSFEQIAKLLKVRDYSADIKILKTRLVELIENGSKGRVTMRFSCTLSELSRCEQFKDFVAAMDTEGFKVIVKPLAGTHYSNIDSVVIYIDTTNIQCTLNVHEYERQYEKHPRD